MVVWLSSSSPGSKNTPTAAAKTTETTRSGPIPTRAGPITIGRRTKTNGCVAHGSLPDAACTPGDVLTTDAQAVCTPGYAGKVRDVTASDIGPGLRRIRDRLAHNGTVRSRSPDQSRTRRFERDRQSLARSGGRQPRLPRKRQGGELFAQPGLLRRHFAANRPARNRNELGRGLRLDGSVIVRKT